MINLSADLIMGQHHDVTCVAMWGYRMMETKLPAQLTLPYLTPSGTSEAQKSLMPWKSKANLVRMNEDSGRSQLTRPSPPLEHRAGIELHCGAPETSIFIWHSNKLLSDCCMVQYSCIVFLPSARALQPFFTPLWPTIRDPALTRWHVITTRVFVIEIVFASMGRGHTRDSVHHFTRCWISLQERPYFRVESHNSSWATPVLTKHQLVITVLEWPTEASSQGAALLPREQCQEDWRRQRRATSHLCPLGCKLTAALTPRIPPKQDKERKRKHHTDSRSFLCHWTKPTDHIKGAINHICLLVFVNSTFISGSSFLPQRVRGGRGLEESEQKAALVSWQWQINILDSCIFHMELGLIQFCW